MVRIKDRDLRRILKAYKVGIAGAGGLGSNLAVSLARLGLGEIVIADFDRVEESNLNRQYFFRDQIGQYKVLALKDNIARIDPKVKLRAHVESLNRDNIGRIFQGVDIFVEALDKRETKALVISEFSQLNKNTKIVAASGISGYKSSNTIRTRRLLNNLYVVGDGVDDDQDYLSPRVNIAAQHQANMVVRLLLGEEEV